MKTLAWASSTFPPCECDALLAQKQSNQSAIDRSPWKRDLPHMHAMATNPTDPAPFLLEL